jgi:membrane protein DedA with SNARE-associated domain
MYRWLHLLAIRGQTGETLAAFISLQTLQDALHVWGYPAVALFIMIESSGIPFPGETMLLLASFLAAIDQQLQLPIVIACAALGAIVGDNCGYLLGRYGGRPLVERFGRYVFLKVDHLERAERFFARHGNKTVFFGRFVAVLRAWAAFLAGVNRMRWSAFLVYNAAGGIVWATLVGLLGYLAGRVFHDNFATVERLARTISWTGALLLALLVVAALVVYRLRRRRQRQKAALRQLAPAEQALAGKTETTETAEAIEAVEAGPDHSAVDGASPAVGEHAPLTPAAEKPAAPAAPPVPGSVNAEDA